MFYRNLLIMHGLTIKHLVNSGDKGLVTCFHWCYLHAACCLHPSILQDAAHCLVIHSSRNIKVCRDTKQVWWGKSDSLSTAETGQKFTDFCANISWCDQILLYDLYVSKAEIVWIVCCASVMIHTADIVGSNHSIVFDIVLIQIML